MSKSKSDTKETPDEKSLLTRVADKLELGWLRNERALKIFPSKCLKLLLLSLSIARTSSPSNLFSQMRQRICLCHYWCSSQDSNEASNVASYGVHDWTKNLVSNTTLIIVGGVRRVNQSRLVRPTMRFSKTPINQVGRLGR